MSYKLYFKSIMDISISLIALVILCPLLFLITCLLVFSIREMPLFLQKRIGKNNKEFMIIKYKTMISKFDEYGGILPDEDRMTFVGNILRLLSIDEIPQLFNILKGDMSLIGPRPLLPEYLPLYNDFQKKRHNVKPGITGWAQVSGRNSISWQNKFEMDVWYVENISFLLDLKILWLTILKILRMEGVYSNNNKTMGKFVGNK